MSTIRKLTPLERGLLVTLRQALADRAAPVANATLMHVVQDLSEHFTFTLRVAPMPEPDTHTEDEVVWVDDQKHLVRTTFGPPDLAGQRTVLAREWLR